MACSLLTDGLLSARRRDGPARNLLADRLQTGLLADTGKSANTAPYCGIFWQPTLLAQLTALSTENTYHFANIQISLSAE